MKLLCSLSEMSVQGGLSYMHFTPILIFDVAFSCMVATFEEHTEVVAAAGYVCLFFCFILNYQCK